MKQVYLKIWEEENKGYAVKAFDADEIAEHISLTEPEHVHHLETAPENAKSLLEYQGQRYWSSDDVQPLSSGNMIS